MRYFLLLCINSYFLLAYGSINYCGSKMCGYTDAHTFCRYPPGPGPSCYGYVESLLSDDEKARVMARLNKRRAEVAQGLRGFPPAGDMLKLRWIEELEREAQRWADQCALPANVEEQDGCRDLYSITVGQCVASIVGEAPGLRPESMVDMWFMQKMHYLGNISEYVAPDSENHYYGDFAQISWSQTYMVGCGRSKFMVSRGSRIRSVVRLVCNFIPRGPVESRPMWYPSAPASACPRRSHPDPEILGLCNYQLGESQTFSEYSTKVEDLEENVLLDVVLELERNKIINKIGTLDEIYLTKLAIATLDQPTITRAYNSPKKRNVIEMASENKISNSSIYDIQNINDESSTKDILFNNYRKDRKRSKFFGRPEFYNIEDLNDVNNPAIRNNNADNNIKEIIQKQDVYTDYEITENQDKAINITSTSEVTFVTLDGFTTSNVSSLVLENTPTMYNDSGLLAHVVDEIISNLTVAEFYNESAVDEKIIDDYLSNPESARELQAAIERMEQKLSTQSESTKIRREILNMENVQNNAELLREIERNRTRERGPVLNMALKYIPYLKSYENTIIGDTSTNKGTLHTNLVTTTLYQCYILFILLIPTK